MGLIIGASATAFAGVVLGSLLRLLLPNVALRVVVFAVLVAVVMREFGVVSFSLPQNARLVPQFVTREPLWGAVQFGAEMGTGMRTYSPTGLPHLVLVSIALLGSWQGALIAGCGFALGRALMLFTFLGARDKTGADHAFDVVLPKLRPLFAVLMLPIMFLLVVAP